ncbi:hypothetical protein AK812_SmicGene17276 [Symbiodinium microadriaticum]|uniref:Uncharacterized protein n=1 Tax=Symbiodinium microadriaticum TaxID=2951 RepID=A0A1Q9DY89_SYMMI|nr:hypothetical protein AK812_SmicGene17276 [Symbiodinium microadriaticum]CAE7509824.1 unnamed protein product [Symbiodinium sp. KB8]
MEPLNEFLRDKLEQELLNRKPIGNPTDELLEAAAENTLNALPGCTWKVLLSWDTVGPYQGRTSCVPFVHTEFPMSLFVSCHRRTSACCAGRSSPALRAHAPADDTWLWASSVTTVQPAPRPVSLPPGLFRLSMAAAQVARNVRVADMNFFDGLFCKHQGAVLGERRCFGRVNNDVTQERCFAIKVGGVGDEKGHQAGSGSGSYGEKSRPPGDNGGNTARASKR